MVMERYRMIDKRVDPLTKVWYEKLRAEGFKDIEVCLTRDKPFYRKYPDDSERFRKHIKTTEHAEYWRLFGLMVNDEIFLSSHPQSDSHLQAMKLFAEGKTVKDIVAATGIKQYMVYKLASKTWNNLLEEFKAYYRANEFSWEHDL